MTLLIIIHTLAATIWVGGHLILSLSILPAAWKKRDPVIISDFEERFEKLGIPALLIQVITGVWMSLKYLPFSDWFDLGNRTSILIITKLFLLSCTIALAIHARLFIIPKLSPEKIPMLGIHILLVTLIGILFLITGLLFRLAGIF